jgi:hypothetical protein
MVQSITTYQRHKIVYFFQCSCNVINLHHHKQRVVIYHDDFERLEHGHPSHFHILKDSIPFCLHCLNRSMEF